jgi:hypothetical protein
MQDLNKIPKIEDLIESRTVQHNDTIEQYLNIARYLRSLPDDSARTRAQFIEDQCNGKIADDIFTKNSESWGIPLFKENILTAQDFKNGFLWTYREFSTSFVDNQKSKNWFLTSYEARFVHNYQFWSSDSGKLENISNLNYTGTYKEILNKLLEQEDWQVLISPVFSTLELKRIVEAYESKYDAHTYNHIFTSYISLNRNWNL